MIRIKPFKPFIVLVINSLILAACFGPAPIGNIPASSTSHANDEQGGVSQPPAKEQESVPATAEPAPTAVQIVVPNDAEHHSDVDLTHLEVGDGRYSAGPQAGYVYTCMTTFNGGGPQGTGSWENGDGTWDATRKAVIDGSVTWPGSFTVSIQGDQRIFASNDLPDHPTGVFPVDPGDDAYSFDRNPHQIEAQSIMLSLPANPTAAGQPNCIGGEAGILLSGVVLFNAFDAAGRDAPVHEVQDNCDGHPQASGFYHYHSLSDCIEDSASGHSALVGYAFDGYGIYGYYGEDGAELTNEDLDACHGHTHMIEWDGQVVDMYHYHATHEFPYVVGCFHGTPAVRALSAGQGQAGGQQQGQGQQPGGTQPQGGGQGNGQQPPQEAINACIGLSQNATCSVGPMNGTCQTPPGTSQLACVPQGGPP